MPRPHKARRRALRSTGQARYPTIEAYIDATGDTQAHIAARCGLSQASVSKIVNGDMIPRALSAARIAKYCRVPLDSFMRTYLAKYAARVA